jgi:hypothetical protein
MVAVRAKSSTIAYTAGASAAVVAVGCAHPGSLDLANQLLHTLGRSSQRHEGGPVDILDCLWHQHLRRTICVRYNTYVLQQLSSRLLLLSKHCSSAVCRPAAGAAAQLPNTDGMTPVPDQRVSAVKSDVAWCTARHSGTC